MYHAAPGRIRFNGNPTLLSSNYVTLLCATLPYARRRFYERSPRLPPPFEKHETQLVRDLYVENYFEGSVLCISTYIYSRLQILEKKSVKLLNYSQQGKGRNRGRMVKSKKLWINWRGRNYTSWNYIWRGKGAARVNERIIGGHSSLGRVFNAR